MRKTILLLIGGTLIDIFTAIASILSFILLFFPQLQTALLASYNSLEIRQTGEYVDATIGSTSEITMLVLGFLLVAFILFFIADTLKFLLYGVKQKRKAVFFNFVIWLAFAFVGGFVGLMLQELFFVFALLPFLQIVYAVIVLIVVCALMLSILLFGKKYFWVQKKLLTKHYWTWGISSVMIGILIGTKNGFAITFGLVLLMVVYNYTLHFVLTKAPKRKKVTTKS